MWEKSLSCLTDEQLSWKLGYLGSGTCSRINDYYTKRNSLDRIDCHTPIQKAPTHNPQDKDFNYLGGEWNRMGPASDIGVRGVLNFGLEFFPEKLSVEFHPSSFQVIKRLLCSSCGYSIDERSLISSQTNAFYFQPPCLTTYYYFNSTGSSVTPRYGCLQLLLGVFLVWEWLYILFITFIPLMSNFPIYSEQQITRLGSTCLWLT